MKTLMVKLFEFLKDEELNLRLQEVLEWLDINMHQIKYEHIMKQH